MFPSMKKKFLLSSLALALLSTPVLAEVHKDSREQKYPAAEVTEISVLNLAGKVLLKGTDGDEIIVRADLIGVGDDPAEAREAASLLGLEASQSGDRVEIITRYPVDDYDDFVYQREGEADGGGLFGWGSSTTTNYMDERVSVRNSGRGLAVHADYELLVPAGVRVIFENKVGDIRAENVNGEMRLDTSSGSVGVMGGVGDVSADTGSGRIEISDREGNVVADTGSGGVELRDIRGDVEADTGSGGVDASGITGDVRADTGSGSVELANVTGSVWVDTGSGGVDGRDLKNVRELEIDTGSGSVELDGDFSTLERMLIDTGSGGVRMRTRGTLNMHLTVSAGSGGVRVDLPEMSNVRTGRGEFEARIGAGEGRGVIDTGSGGVRITSE